MMRRAGCARTVVLSLSILGLAAWPAAADWSIGSNLGLSVLMPGQGADNIVLLDVPTGSGLGFFMIGTQPGLRFGFTNDARQEEFHLDGGIAAIAGSGDAFTAVQIAGLDRQRADRGLRDRPADLDRRRARQRTVRAALRPHRRGQGERLHPAARAQRLRDALRLRPLAEIARDARSYQVAQVPGVTSSREWPSGSRK